MGGLGLDDDNLPISNVSIHRIRLKTPDPWAEKQFKGQKRSQRHDPRRKLCVTRHPQRRASAALPRSVRQIQDIGRLSKQS